MPAMFHKHKRIQQRFGPESIVSAATVVALLPKAGKGKGKSKGLRSVAPLMSGTQLLRGQSIRDIKERMESFFLEASMSELVVLREALMMADSERIPGVDECTLGESIMWFMTGKGFKD